MPNIPSVERIVADTSFLLSQFEYGVDLPAELLRILAGPAAIVIASGVERELLTLSGRTGRRATAARFALQSLPGFGKRFKMERVESDGPADEWIIKYAQKNKTTVATNDVPLRRRLLSLGVKVIALKGKSKLSYV